MRFSLAVVGILLVVSACDAAVVQRRYRNAGEILVPVTVIQDGEEINDVKLEEDLIDAAGSAAVIKAIAQAVDEEQNLEAVAQRRIDEGVFEDEIKQVVAEENGNLLKAIQEEQPAEVKPQDIDQQFLVDEKKLSTEEQLSEIKLELDQQNQDMKKAVDAEIELEGTLRQATQATPSQTTTQQNFVQQFIQNSPLGQFFNQITGQNNQGQVANDDATASAPVTPAPTVPAFLAPAVQVAQSVVNSTTSAFQGLTNFASNLGSQFQSTLSNLGGQPVQQTISEVTTARPQGPFQQLVNTFMGNNNQQSSSNNQPTPQQQGPLQGLLNIFQGNNNNQPQGNTPASDSAQPQPGKEPEVVEQTQEAIEDAAAASADNLSNDIRSSSEVDDSFEEVVQPEEMIVVQDDASQTQQSDQDKVQAIVYASK